VETNHGLFNRLRGGLCSSKDLGGSYNQNIGGGWENRTGWGDLDVERDEEGLQSLKMETNWVSLFRKNNEHHKRVNEKSINSKTFHPFTVQKIKATSDDTEGKPPDTELNASLDTKGK